MFVKRKIAPFPHSAARNTGPGKRDDIEVYCHCRMPELNGVPMIERTSCSTLRGWPFNIKIIHYYIIAIAAWYVIVNTPQAGLYGV